MSKKLIFLILSGSVYINIILDIYIFDEYILKIINFFSTKKKIILILIFKMKIISKPLYKHSFKDEFLDVYKIIKYTVEFIV